MILHKVLLVKSTFRTVMFTEEQLPILIILNPTLHIFIFRDQITHKNKAGIATVLLDLS